MFTWKYKYFSWKERYGSEYGDTLIRASLLALAGSRRAALLGLEGFCLCHFGKGSCCKRPFMAQVWGKLLPMGGL